MKEENEDRCHPVIRAYFVGAVRFCKRGADIIAVDSRRREKMSIPTSTAGGSYFVKHLGDRLRITVQLDEES